MKILIAPIDNFVKSEKTEISADVVAGSDKEITVKNSANYAVDDYIIVGIEGKEISEITKISAIVGNVLTATLSLAHKNGEVITKILFNQRKLYGCATKDGTFILIETKNIEVDNPQGTQFEYTGTTYLYFKATYYNSTTTTETSIDDAEAVLGGESDRYCSIYAIKRQAGLVDNPYISDTDIERKRKDAENEIDSAIFKKYSLPLTSIPGLIENIAILLAAGYIDYQEFGKEGSGVEWLGEGRGLLKNIVEGKRRLLDSDKVELSKTSSGQLKGYPNSVCEDTDDDRKFEINDSY